MSSTRLIVIAASAGGLEAIAGVLSLLPADFPAAIAVLQHRGPEFPERLVDLLRGWTSLRVCHAADGVPLVAGTVYVCPPGVHMVAERSLRLIEGPRLNFVRPSADLMLDSAARVYGDCAVGVVLSGCGSDGALGCLSISRAGGVVIAQEANSCLHPGMPLAAAGVGATELRLPPAQIAAALQEIARGLPLTFAAPDAVAVEGESGSTRVLLADDHRIVLDGLRVLIDGEDDMNVVADANNGDDAVRRATEISPDVVVMDVCMPGIDGIDATRQIVLAAPSARVVALSSQSDSTTVNRILAAGATAYLTKQRAFGELVRAIRAVRSDKIYFSDDIARLVAAGRVRSPRA